MKAMVLAAGLGTRFRPVTDSLPKPLVPLCNRPLIAWAIDSLRDGGVDEIVVNLHHHPELLKRWLDAEYTGRCDLRYSFEPEILGTGGGLRKARGFFERDELFFLVNGDSVQFPPWAALAESIGATGAVALMLLRHPPRDDRFTSVWLEEARVTSIGPLGKGEPLMFSGVHALTPRIFEWLPDRDFSGMTEDVYLPMLARRGGVIAGVVHDGLWFDVGNPWRYLHASLVLTAALARGELSIPRGSRVCGDASIADESVRLDGRLSRSVAGKGVLVGADSSVVDSALWDGARIATGAHLEMAIIGSGVVIPAGASVNNALVWKGEGGLQVVAIDPARPASHTGF